MKAVRGQAVRGEVVRVKFEHLAEPKLWVVVSNNRRNRALLSFIGARLTTSAKPPIPSIVEVPEGEGVVGRVVCDDLVEIYHDEILSLICGLSPNAMAEVNEGLAAALDL